MTSGFITWRATFSGVKRLKLITDISVLWISEFAESWQNTSNIISRRHTEGVDSSAFSCPTLWSTNSSPLLLPPAGLKQSAKHRKVIGIFLFAEATVKRHRNYFYVILTKISGSVVMIDSLRRFRTIKLYSCHIEAFWQLGLQISPCFVFRTWNLMMIW